VLVIRIKSVKTSSFDYLGFMTDVPEALKAIKPFIQRANELVVAEPAIAYWCMMVIDVSLIQVYIGLRSKVY
jgi:hypothetical protein